MPQPDTASASARVELDASLRSLRLAVPEEVARDLEAKANRAIEAAAAAPPPPEPPARDTATPAPPGAVSDLGDAIEDNRIAISTMLGAWNTLPDDLDRVAAMLARDGVSPTGVAESLRTATHNARLVTEALREGSY